MLKARSVNTGMREKQQSSFYGLGILVGLRNGQLTVVSPLEMMHAGRATSGRADTATRGRGDSRLSASPTPRVPDKSLGSPDRDVKESG